MFSIIIPVFNEEKIIVENTESIINFLNNLQTPYEIIIVDNGSTDNTGKKGKFLEKKYPKNVRFFSIDKRGAVGWVFREAVIVAKYDKIISVDMDLSVDLSFIPKCLELLNDHNIIIGLQLPCSALILCHPLDRID